MNSKRQLRYGKSFKYVVVLVFSHVPGSFSGTGFFYSFWLTGAFFKLAHNFTRMIQRIQTLWLALAAVCSLLTLKFSFYSGITGTENKYSQLTGVSNLWLTIITVATAVVSLAAIFMYKKRDNQQWVVLGALILQVVTLFLYFSSIRQYTQGTYDLTSILSFAVIVLQVLAFMGIRKDIRMIRSMDRLR
jgi:uncharacterized membrane protein